ncbi:zinc-dependent metalloprotease [Haloglomus halophilum]|uniref:zinc-dependent metalloprotease n=1 Tax=Haloglomus halophilum TaxID=2962672 RepID=UPI0020C958F0|nr:zinc-dependent metalloprotease [Haloglomus halophilum]
MTIFGAIRAVADAPRSGDGPVDWDGAAEAAKATVSPGNIELTPAEREGYATDVRDARNRVRDVTGLGFDLPETVEVQHRHHWIDANIATFRRVMEPLAELETDAFGIARTTNTGSMAVMLSFLANNVLGQYDPLLLADGDDHALYFVHPNIERVAESLDVETERFRRWIAFHEVTHAAEFGAAPWLSEHLETRMESAVDDLTEGSLNRDAIGELDTVMTSVEGYAELVMDRAFDDEYEDLRAKLEARRSGRGPLSKLLRRLLGLGMKRRQYERGKAFFDAVADARSVEAAGVVWSDPDLLPTDEELDNPEQWLARVPEA